MKSKSNDENGIERPSSELEALVQIQQEREKLYKRFSAFAIIAPILGLVGTVAGMVQVFHSISSGGDLSSLQNGLQVALIVTVIGLLIAIVGLLWGNYLRYVTHLKLFKKRQPAAFKEHEQTLTL